MRRVLDQISPREIESTRLYPSTDGKPMGESTWQIYWIMMFYTNLSDLFANREDVFVAADLFWYPVEGKPKIVTAPDVMVALDRPKRHRASYRQWEEENIPPQVVIEILSESNNDAEMEKKQEFYRKYGVEEYYVFVPATNSLQGYLRRQNQFREIWKMDGWASPRLGIRFDLSSDLVVLHPNGIPFKTISELRREALDRQEAYLKKEAEARRERRRANAAEKIGRSLGEQVEELSKQTDSLGEQVEQLSKQTDSLGEQVEQLSKQTDLYRQKLLELGIDPNSLK